MATQTTAKKPASKKKPTVKKVAAKKTAPKKTVKKMATTQKKTTSKAVKNTVAQKRRSLKIKKPTLRKPVFSFSQLVGLLLVSGVVLFVVSIGVWWYAIVMNPDRALSDMLRKSLSVNGVTRTVTQEDPTGTMHQVVRMSFVPSASVLTTTTMKQSDGTGSTSTIVTEAVGTTRENFVRYTMIDTPGQVANYDNILNIWGRQDTVNDPTSSSFLNDSSVAIVPMGSLSPGDRAQVLAILEGKQVFSKYDSARREKQNGREVFVYQVRVNLSDLVEALATYARLTGLGDASQLDPAAYAGAQPLTLELTVDILSRHLSSITYSDSGREEVYSGYGLRRAISVPEHGIIGFEELQSRIQNISQ